MKIKQVFFFCLAVIHFGFSFANMLLQAKTSLTSKAMGSLTHLNHDLSLMKSRTEKISIHTVLGLYFKNMSFYFDSMLLSENCLNGLSFSGIFRTRNPSTPPIALGDDKTLYVYLLDWKQISVTQRKIQCIL